ncbi:MAG: sterol desaturase family protein [Mycobacteriaceae bacterium]
MEVTPEKEREGRASMVGGTQHIEGHKLGLFNLELPVFGEKHRRTANIFAAVGATTTVISMIGTMYYFNVVTLPGEEHPVTFTHLLNQLESYSESLFRYWAFVVAVVFVALYRLRISLRGFFEYEKSLGKKINLQEATSIFGLNLINLMFSPIVIGLVGILALFWNGSLLNKEFFNLYEWMRETVTRLLEFVPTVVSLSPWPAFFVSYTLVTFIHYWVHRLAHTRRFLWLTLHRTHHISENLTMVTIAPVVASFPLWPLMLVPYLLTYGAITGLFTDVPLYHQWGLFFLGYTMIDGWSHSAALYEEGVKKKWLVLFGSFNGTGLHHVLHHSAGDETQRKSSNNTVNIGPGFFYVWDKIFGTYEPLSKNVPEKFGLHGDEKIFMNPLRIAMAGIMQIGYELKNNKGLLTKVKILVGTTEYKPQITKDYLFKAGANLAHAA